MAYTTIDDPSEYFQTALYTGSDDASATKVVTNDGNSDLQPDWLWFKRRNSGANYAVQDTSRGIGNGLSTSTNGVEVNDDFGVTAIGSDGFSVRENTSASGEINQGSMVCWQWKANGGTTTTNDASSTSIGTVDSVIQANTEAGFSIVTFQGGSNTFSMAHGLGAVPELIISKRKDTDTGNWHVYHKFTGRLGATFLNTTGAFADAPYFADTDPTSTVFSQSNSAIENGEGAVAYCFRSIQGYSKIGSYSGNGNSNGTFVHLGFKPSWILVKRTNSAESWQLVDTKRSPINVMDEVLRPDDQIAEQTNQGGGDSIDFVSNGFKTLSSAGQFNNGSSTYIYLAFAERPFVSSEGVPTTAR